MDDFAWDIALALPRLLARFVATTLGLAARYLWWRWTWGDPFERDMANQSWRAVLRRALLIGASLAALTGVGAGLASLVVMV